MNLTCVKAIKEWPNSECSLVVVNKELYNTEIKLRNEFIT